MFYDDDQTSRFPSIPHLGSLQRVVSHFPQILTVPVKTVKSMAMFLREKCLFTVQQVTDILRDTPAVVLENTDQLEYKFQVGIIVHSPILGVHWIII